MSGTTASRKARSELLFDVTNPMEICSLFEEGDLDAEQTTIVGRCLHPTAVGGMDWTGNRSVVGARVVSKGN
jgi:hypothetical protein